MHVEISRDLMRRFRNAYCQDEGIGWQDRKKNIKKKKPWMTLIYHRLEKKFQNNFRVFNQEVNYQNCFFQSVQCNSNGL